MSVQALGVGAGKYNFRARLRNTGTTNVSGYSHKVPLTVSSAKDRYTTRP